MRIKPTTLFCFSPGVMLATFIIEILLLVLLIARLGLKSQKTRLVAVLLLLLALFQLAEYFVCGGMGHDAQTWARLGFVVITLLPPLGLYLAYLINSQRSNVWRAAIVLSSIHALVWVGLFQFVGGVFGFHMCAPNYAVLELTSPYRDQYFLYYYGWLALTIVLAYRASRTAKKDRRQQLHWLIVGYGAFLIPTGITNLVEPQTLAAIPSIMCGFAVIFAFILVFGVLNVRSGRSNIDKQ